MVMVKAVVSVLMLKVNLKRGNIREDREGETERVVEVYCSTAVSCSSSVS